MIDFEWYRSFVSICKQSRMGISLLPSYLIRDSLSLGRTKTILPEYTAENDLYLAYRIKEKEQPVLQLGFETLTGVIP